MRVRRMDANGDMTFGNGTADFLVDVPAAVAQVGYTRVNLWVGQWYLDLDEGTPWDTQVLGTGTQSIYDQAIVDRILGTTGAYSMQSYSSDLDTTTRALTFSGTLNTLYGTTALSDTVG